MDLRRCRNATIGALKFLLRQQHPDGSFAPVEYGMATHSKLLWALGDMGQGPKATQLCAWLREHALDEEGDFSGQARPAPYDRYYSAGNAFLALGAMRLGQFAVGYPALGLLTSLQHPATGGFLTAGPDATLDDEQDAYTAAVCGYACLQGGQLEAAEGAGRFLVALLDAQPAAARLYLVARGALEVVREFPEEQAAWYLVDAGQPEQWYHVPALAAGFLGALYDATGGEPWREGLNRFLQYLDSCAEDRYTSERSAWVGWAAAVAYELTGSANYLRVVETAAEAVLVNQLNNGSWLTGSTQGDLTSDVMDATAENVIVLNQILRSVPADEG